VPLPMVVPLLLPVLLLRREPARALPLERPGSDRCCGMGCGMAWLGEPALQDGR